MIRSFIIAAVVALGFSTAVQANDAPTQSLLQQAKAATARGAFDEAATIYQQVLEVCPRNLDAYRGLAWVCNEEKKYDEAFFWIGNGLKIHNADAGLLLELGYTQWKTGNLGAAKATLNKVLAINPSFEPAYDYLIAIHQQLEEHGDVYAVLARKQANLKL